MTTEAISLSELIPMTRMQVEYFVRVASRFSSRIIIEHKNRTINGKSMLGLLSLGSTGDDEVYLIVEGEDEQLAAHELTRLLNGGLKPPKDTSDAEQIMLIIKQQYADILGDKLLGIYVHGSLAQQCFHWASSDIDFITVVQSPLTPGEKLRLIAALHDMKDDLPPRGVEMSVMLREVCRDMPYPAPFELHYSPMWEKKYLENPEKFCENMHGVDFDLASHVMSLHHAGIAVYGPSITRVFGDVRPADFLDAVRRDLKDIEGQLNDEPVYILLTLCRALIYIREGRVESKQAAGHWALASLDPACRPLILAALDAYENGAAMRYDKQLAARFAGDAVREIEAYGNAAGAPA